MSRTCDRTMSVRQYLRFCRDDAPCRDSRDGANLQDPGGNDRIRFLETKMNRHTVIAFAALLCGLTLSGCMHQPATQDEAQDTPKCAAGSADAAPSNQRCLNNIDPNTSALSGSSTGHCFCNGQTPPGVTTCIS